MNLVSNNGLTSKMETRSFIQVYSLSPFTLVDLRLCLMPSNCCTHEKPGKN